MRFSSVRSLRLARALMVARERYPTIADVTAAARGLRRLGAAEL